MKKHLLLAYSGGLDTSVILKWLIEAGNEVSCYIADVGQKEDVSAVKNKALSLGAHTVIIDDLKQSFVNDYIVPYLQTGAIYEGRYMLGTALARPLIAKGMVKTAHKLNVSHCAHGATGKGNDQIRFELGILQLMPEATIVTPWRDPAFLKQFSGRQDLLNYAHQKNIPVEATQAKPYSTDANLMHVSYEGGALEDASDPPDENMFQMTVSPEAAPDTATTLKLSFTQGRPSQLDYENQTVTDPYAILEAANMLAGKHGIGRIDIIENRRVGMKSRGVYETPGFTVLAAAHHDLELLTLDREVLRLKASLGPKIAETIYNGLWFSPEMAFLMAAIHQSQETVTGEVHLKLYKGNVIITGRSSPYSLYEAETASMDLVGNYDAGDADGFIKIEALRLQMAARTRPMAIT